MNDNIILTAHQPSYLPWLGLFHKIWLSNIYIYLDMVQFEKNSFTNRNLIKTSTGIMWLTVPVKLKSHTSKFINEIEIDNSKNWRNDHWKSIFFNYKKAKYFKTYGDFFEDVYKKDWTKLTDLNEYMLKWFIKQLGIKTEFYKGSDLDLSGKKSDLIICMCNKFQANCYVFGALGKSYADKNSFAKKNINIYFQDYVHPIYLQLFGQFQPRLGILDLLFNYGENSLNVLCSDNIDRQFLLKNLL